MKDLIFETEYWSIKLDATDQTYVGRSFVIAKRPCPDLAELTDEELLDFKNVVSNFEHAARKAFHATMFNWSCLMNGAYQNNPPDPWVHWHVRPRYDHQVDFESQIFEDIDFGHHYLRGTNRIVDDEIKNKIIQAIKNNLK